MSTPSSDYFDPSSYSSYTTYNTNTPSSSSSQQTPSAQSQQRQAYPPPPPASSGGPASTQQMAFTGVGTQSGSTLSSSYGGGVDEFSEGFSGGDLQFQVSPSSSTRSRRRRRLVLVWFGGQWGDNKSDRHGVNGFRVM